MGKSKPREHDWKMIGSQWGSIHPDRSRPLARRPTYPRSNNRLPPFQLIARRGLFLSNKHQTCPPHLWHCVVALPPLRIENPGWSRKWENVLKEYFRCVACLSNLQSPTIQKKNPYKLSIQSYIIKNDWKNLRVLIGRSTICLQLPASLGWLQTQSGRLSGTISAAAARSHTKSL